MAHHSVLQVKLQALQGWAALVETLTLHARPDLVTVADQVYPGVTEAMNACKPCCLLQAYRAWTVLDTAAV